MIKYLFEIGLSIDDIKNIFDINLNYINDDSEELRKIVELLKLLKISDSVIKELIISNPLIVNRTYEDVLELIKTLKKYKIDDIGYIFEINPFFINKDSYEIDEFYKNSNKTQDEITDLIQSNPYIIEE